MNINTESGNWAIEEENIALRRLFEITTTSREAEIRKQWAILLGKKIP